MRPLLINPKPTTEEDMKLFLYAQIQVGKILIENPEVLAYIERQVAMLIAEITRPYEGNAEALKDYVVKRNVQIATYKHLHDLAVENDALIQEYTRFTDPQPQESDI